MNPDFWLDRWSRGQIGFHQPHVDRLLEAYWGALHVAPGRQVFVPLCGKSLDLLWLRDRGYDVLGVELSARAVESFFAEQGIAARRRPLAGFDRYEAGSTEILRGDFFGLTPPALAAVAAVYDRAALIAWAPAMRERYAARLIEMLPRGTPIFLITLEYAQHERDGPPFSVTKTEIDRLFGRRYEVRETARRDVLADEPQTRERGFTALAEACWQLVGRN